MKYRVWHIPQVPMKSFDVDVESLAEAKLLLDVFADYDKFQFDNNIKPDYANASGAMVPDPEKPGDWIDWNPEDFPDFMDAVKAVCPDVFDSVGGLDDLTLVQVRAVEENLRARGSAGE